MKRVLVSIALVLFAVLAIGTPAPPLHAARATTITVVEQALPIAAADEKVVFNTKSLKYHCATCTWAKRCTRNCITTTLADAQARGGVPCKVCGGTCKSTSSDHSSNQHVRCCDGTFSPTCTTVHSGCCSHHGGVCQ